MSYDAFTRFLDRAHPVRTARENEAEALRRRTHDAVVELLGLPIPKSLRDELRVFEASLEPAIIEHERNAI